MTDSLNPSRSDPLMPGKIIYGLYAVGFFLAVTFLVGVVYAYLAKGRNPVLDSHLRFQIRTFWISLLIGIVGIVTSIIGIGFLVLIFLTVWGLVRIISGFLLLNEGKAVARTRVMGLLAVPA